MNTNKRFSDLIIKLTETWMMWMKYNTISHDNAISFKERRAAGEECEYLINREYEIVEEMDKIFEK